MCREKCFSLVPYILGDFVFKSNGLIRDMLAHELRENLLLHIPALTTKCLLFMCAYTNLMHRN